MRLKVLLPTQILVDEPTQKVIAEAENGSFCLLPRHIDFVTALAPGILYYTPEEGEERFLAVDQGTLVKCGDEILLSTFNAIPGSNLAELKRAVTEQFLELDEHERQARSALARLEAGAIRRFIQQEQTSRG